MKIAVDFVKTSVVKSSDSLKWNLILREAHTPHKQTGFQLAISTDLTQFSPPHQAHWAFVSSLKGNCRRISNTDRRLEHIRQLLYAAAESFLLTHTFGSWVFTMLTGEQQTMLFVKIWTKSCLSSSWILFIKVNINVIPNKASVCWLSAPLTMLQHHYNAI